MNEEFESGEKSAQIDIKLGIEQLIGIFGYQYWERENNRFICIKSIQQTKTNHVQDAVANSSIGYQIMEYFIKDCNLNRWMIIEVNKREVEI